MFAFDVQDMTCGHCVAAITRAVKALDPVAVVEVDLAQHRVRVVTREAAQDTLAHAIRDAGYTPVAVG